MAREPLLFEGAHASLTFQTRLILAMFTENFPSVLSSCTPSVVKFYSMCKISVSLSSGEWIPTPSLRGGWVSFTLLLPVSSAIMSVLFFLAGDTLGAAWHGRKVSHTLTHKHCGCRAHYYL